MPQDQAIRDLVARMKLIPIRELIQGQRLLFCEDSIVRGTQLKDTIQRLYDYGAR
jgi:amidophosphoribosyltransferase